jgi:hypothetical protein
MRCLICQIPLLSHEVDSCSSCERTLGVDRAINICNAIKWRRGMTDRLDWIN